MYKRQNLLCYGVWGTFKIGTVFKSLSLMGIVYVFTLFPIFALIILLIAELPFWRHFILSAFDYALVFYLLQVFSFALGLVYYKEAIRGAVEEDEDIEE